MPDAIIIIPARMQSTRLPDKPLVDIDGRPLLWWTYQQAKKVGCRVLVTSPDREIIQYCRNEKIPAMPSAASWANGTQRCYEMSILMTSKYDRYINWQVDEPNVEIADVVGLINSSTAPSTLYSSFPDVEGIREDPNEVKVIVDDRNHCRWFSRLPLPTAHRHVGVYSFEREFLEWIGGTFPRDAALAESLEQLTWLQMGCDLRAMPASSIPLSINTQKDLDLFRSYLQDAKKTEDE